MNTLTWFQWIQLLGVCVMAALIAPMRRATQRSQAEALASRKRYRAWLARELRSVRTRR